MSFMFPTIMIVVFLVSYYGFRLYPGLALLLSGGLASLAMGLPEPWFRWVFATGSVTDLLLRLAMGAVIAEILIRNGVFRNAVAWVEQKIELKYFRNILVALIVAFPSFISGSFLIGEKAAKSLWSTEEKPRFFYRLAVLMGVLAPPFNPYFELLKLGRGWEMRFNWRPLGLILLVVLLMMPFFRKKEKLVEADQLNPVVFHFCFWPTLVYVLWDLVVHLSGYYVGPTSFILVLFLFTLLALVNLRSFPKSLEAGLRVALPVLLCVLATGFGISVAASAGYRGEAVLHIINLSSVAKVWFFLVSAALLGAINPYLALILVGVPMIVDGVPHLYILTSFLLIIATVGYFVPWSSVTGKFNLGGEKNVLAILRGHFGNRSSYR